MGLHYFAPLTSLQTQKDNKCIFLINGEGQELPNEFQNGLLNQKQWVCLRERSFEVINDLLIKVIIWKHRLCELPVMYVWTEMCSKSNYLNQIKRNYHHTEFHTKKDTAIDWTEEIVL